MGEYERGICITAAVFKVIHDPRLHDNVSSDNVSSLLPDGWVPFWSRDVGSSEGIIFKFLFLFPSQLFVQSIPQMNILCYSLTPVALISIKMHLCK